MISRPCVIFWNDRNFFSLREQPHVWPLEGHIYAKYMYEVPGLIYTGTGLLGVSVTKINRTQHCLPGIYFLQRKLLKVAGKFSIKTLEGEGWNYFAQISGNTLTKWSFWSDLRRKGAGIWGWKKQHLQKLKTKRSYGNFVNKRVQLFLAKGDCSELGGIYWRGDRRWDWEINEDRIVKDLFTRPRR